MRLDVVHHGRLAEEAFHGGKRRLDPRPGPLALQALDQAGLFAADIGPRPAMDEQVERVVRAEDILAQVAGRVGLVDGRLHALAGKRILVAEIEVGGRRLRGVGAEDDAFDDLVRIAFHLHAIDERARLALVGIDAEIDRPGVIFGQERPLQGRGETGPAAAPQPGRPHGGEHVVGAHFLQRLAQGAIPAAGLVDGQLVAVLFVNVRQQYGFVGRHGKIQGSGIRDR